MKKILALTMAVLLWAAPAMSADVMVWKVFQDRPDLSIEEFRSGLIHKGDIYACYPDYTVEFPYTESANRTFIRVQPMTVEECESYKNAWVRTLDYTVVNSNSNGWRIDVFATVPGVSQYGGITREMVENYITRWGGSVVSVDQNSVRFDLGRYEMATSEGFWHGHNVSAVVFDQVSFNNVSGITRISADYTGAPYVGMVDQVNEVLESMGATVITNDGAVVVYDILKESPLEAFKFETRERLEGILWFRQYYVAPADIDTVEAQGGMEITRTQWDANLKDRTLDP